jgi:hypothetical protein
MQNLIPLPASVKPNQGTYTLRRARPSLFSRIGRKFASLEDFSRIASDLPAGTNCPSCPLKPHPPAGYS